MAEKTLIEAVHDAMWDEMKRDERIFVMGEDVGEGGVFRATEGFMQEFGDGRVIDTPLAEAGIDYVHLKALGTPAEGRAAARAGRQKDLERIYSAQLDLPEAIVQAQQMRELAAEMPSALLCYEREPACCHRSLLIAAAAPEASVTHLFP